MPRKAQCAACSKPIQLGRGSLPAGEARCRDCIRAEVVHGTVKRGYRKGCRCADCTEANRLASAEYRRSFEERTGRGYYDGYARKSRPRADARCTGCGDLVRGAYRKDRPYHRSCRERAEAAERKRARAARRLERAASGTSGSRVWVMGECAECLVRFTRLGCASRFCSKQCSRKARPSRSKFKISLRDRLAIYERDQWSCQLCREPVDRDLMTTDPLNDWAPSLDHIEPQSWALIPDHSPANLRLAHRWCNSVRGDETWYSESDLRAA